MLCQYKNMFGEPNKGLHSIRFMNLAVIDIALTIFVPLIISYYFDIDFLCLFVIFFILGMVLHHIFCVDTTINMFINKYIIRQNNNSV